METVVGMMEPRHEISTKDLIAQRGPEMRARAEELRREAKEMRVLQEAARRAILQLFEDSGRLSELGVHDLESAVSCLCHCHPSVDLSVHRGSPCSCQEDRETRTRNRESLLREIQRLGQQQSGAEDSEQDAVRRAAQELGLVVEMAGGAAPYQITGVAHGTRFYLRERHGEWSVRVPDDAAGPEGDPTGVDNGSYVVAEGSAESLYSAEDPARPLRVAASAVEGFIRARRCLHPDAGRFCPDCGMRCA